MTEERDRRLPDRAVFLGSGAFAVPALRALAADPAIELVAVITAPPRPAGRGRDPRRTPIEVAARELGIERILTPARLRAPDAVATILDLRPELAVLADYGQIVPPTLLEMRHGALNLHPSLLPRHRGATPIPAAILADDTETGVTLIRMDHGLDTGPIVGQVRHRLDGTETTPVLEVQLAGLAAELLVDRLGPWIRGEIDVRPQAATGVSLTRPLRRDDGRLDPTRPAGALERQIRAYQPWPGSFVDTIFGRLVVWSASAGPVAADRTGSDGTAPAGAFVGDGLVVGDGEQLVLGEVQPSGGRRMGWAAYRRGRPGIVGSRTQPTES